MSPWRVGTGYWPHPPPIRSKVGTMIGTNFSLDWLQSNGPAHIIFLPSYNVDTYSLRIIISSLESRQNGCPWPVILLIRSDTSRPKETIAALNLPEALANMPSLMTTSPYVLSSKIFYDSAAIEAGIDPSTDRWSVVQTVVHDAGVIGLGGGFQISPVNPVLQLIQKFESGNIPMVTVPRKEIPRGRCFSLFIISKYCGCLWSGGMSVMSLTLPLPLPSLVRPDSINPLTWPKLMKSSKLYYLQARLRILSPVRRRSATSRGSTSWDVR